MSFVTQGANAGVDVDSLTKFILDVKGNVAAGERKFAATIFPYAWLKAVSISGE